MDSLSVHVLTIFPGMIESFLHYGIVRRAIDKKLLTVSFVNVRDFATDRHRTVDDTPYGGGAGMILKPDVLSESLKSIPSYGENKRPHVIFMTPQGKRFNQSHANRLSLMDEFVLVCGRYRAIDERFRELYVDEEFSIGDYVISGGEVAAMVVVDAVARLMPGVMHDFDSGMGDSFQNGLLDCPWYTRPETFEDIPVPDVLLSGNHAEIKKWRYQQSLKRTKDRRPDLFDE